jgi:hypothetical protein
VDVASASVPEEDAEIASVDTNAFLSPTLSMDARYLNSFRLLLIYFLLFIFIAMPPLREEGLSYGEVRSLPSRLPSRKDGQR